MNDSLKDPYEDEPTARTSVRTEHTVHSVRPGIHDYNHIKSTHARNNTLQLTFYYLLTKFVNELKRANIGPEYNPDAYERALVGCTIVLPRGDGGSNAYADREDPSRDVGLGDRSLARPDAGHQLLPPDNAGDDKGASVKKKRVRKTNPKSA